MNEHGLAASHRILMSAAFVFVRVERHVIPLRSDRSASLSFLQSSVFRPTAQRARRMGHEFAFVPEEFVNENPTVKARKLRGGRGE